MVLCWDVGVLVGGDDFAAVWVRRVLVVGGFGRLVCLMVLAGCLL